MTLTPRDFSIFDEAVNDWTPIHGVFKLYVGTSSDNLPLSIEVTRSKISDWHWNYIENI